MPSALKKTLYLIPVLALLGAGLLWALVATERGTQMLFDRAVRFSGGTVEWESMQGSLLGPLRFESLSIRHGDLSADLESVELDWSPGGLTAGLLQINSLSASGIRILIAETGETPPSAEPFLPADLTMPLDFSLQGVELRDVEVSTGEDPALVIEKFRGDLQLLGRRLSLQHVELRIPGGGLEGSGSLELENLMSVGLDMQWDWEMGDTHGSNGQVPPAAISGLAGKLLLTGELNWLEPLTFDLNYLGSGEQLDILQPDLPGHLAFRGGLHGRLEGEELALSGMSLVLEEYPLKLDIAGKLQLAAAGAPTFDGRLSWRNMKWPLASTTPDVVSAEGVLELAGTTDRYDFVLATDLAGNDFPEGEWQGRGSGDLLGLQFEELRGKLLDGELRVTGALVWDPVLSWALQLDSQSIDPGPWLPDLPGPLGLSLYTTGVIEAEELKAEFDVARLTGQFAGYDYQLSARGDLAGDDVNLQGLLVESGANQLAASGQLSLTQLLLEWQLHAPDPGVLLPGVEGLLTGDGSLLGSPDKPRLQARLQGRDLNMDGLSIPALRADLDAGLQADEPLRLELDLGPVFSGDQLLLTTAGLRAQGSNSDHRLDIELQSPNETMRAQLQGGLNTALENWNGHLQQLDVGTEDFGNWQLIKPAAVQMAQGEMTLAETCLEETVDAIRMCFEADWLDVSGGVLAASLQSLPIKRLLPDLDAELNGDLSARLSVDGAVTARASIAMSPGEIRIPLELEQGVEQLAHGGGSVELTIGPDGLDVDLRFDAPEQGLVRGSLHMPHFNQLPLKEPQPVTGHIQAELPDLGVLPAWIPELAATRGRLHMDLQLAGNLDQPLLAGELVLSDGMADIPVAGLKLREIVLKASADPDRPGPLALSGGLVSGTGRVNLDGWLDVERSTLELNIKGERVQVYRTADVHVLASPDLTLAFRDQTLRLRGNIVIPEASITPKLAIGPGLISGDPVASEAQGPGLAIAPSADVRILGAEVVPVAQQLRDAPFQLDSQVQLILGERVKVNTLGFISRIVGAVTLINPPEKVDMIPTAYGGLSVVDGTFRAFGQDLDIEVGQLIFAQVPVTEPELNVRAVRWIDNDPQVSAVGVLITGPATEPTMELFSRPQIDPNEIQSYLLTGRSAGDKENVLGIGTYLQPKFYVGYGYNLLEKTSEFNSLYTITPRYGVGVSVGEADNNMNLTFTLER